MLNSSVLMYMYEDETTEELDELLTDEQAVKETVEDDKALFTPLEIVFIIYLSIVFLLGTTTIIYLKDE